VNSATMTIAMAAQIGLNAAMQAIAPASTANRAASGARRRTASGAAATMASG